MLQSQPKYYKMVKSHFIKSKSLVPINSILVKTITRRFNKSGRELTPKFECYCQGMESKMNEINFTYLLQNNLISEIDKPNDDILYGYVLESNDYSKRKKLLALAKKTFKDYESQLTTIGTWVFSTKGSPAATFKAEDKFQNNREFILQKTTFRGGIGAKPGSPVKNRATRQTVISNEVRWEADETSLLPDGIRESDSCSYSESVRIFDKLITEVISMKNTPSDLVEFFTANGYQPMNTFHVDYFYKTPIDWKLFEQNTHHGKVKGLEFCHIDTELGLNTTVDNITIGLCESNRHQGGYSLEYTDKKILIKKIYEAGFNSDIEFLNNLSLQNLEEIYFKFKFKN